ncbi:MAG: sortase domain-containing protein, partial [Nocardioidaceae bacterium]
TGLFTVASVLLVWAGISLAAAQPPPPEPESRLIVSPAHHSSKPQAEQGQPRPPRQLPPPPPVQRPLLAAEASDAAADPTAIRIPLLGIDQHVVELGVSGTTLQVPDQYSDVGWWSGGPAPGERGATVMVGHVDSETGPAVFYQLSGLRRGDRVVIRSEDNSRSVFAVDKVIAYARDEFPSAQVYRSDGKPALHLVTCGGLFDTDRGQYTSNVVAFAPLIKRVPPPRAKKPASTDGHRPTARPEPKGDGASRSRHADSLPGRRTPASAAAQSADGSRPGHPRPKH